MDLRELRQDIGWVSSALTEKIPAWDTGLSVVLSGAFATFGLYTRPGPELVAQAQSLMEDMDLSRLSGQEFSQFSAGEKQRILLARSRLAKPRLLILDEPCAGLDLASREKLLAQVDRMAQDPEEPDHAHGYPSGLGNRAGLHPWSALEAGPDAGRRPPARSHD